MTETQNMLVLSDAEQKEVKILETERITAKIKYADLAAQVDVMEVQLSSVRQQKMAALEEMRKQDQKMMDRVILALKTRGEDPNSTTKKWLFNIDSMSFIDKTTATDSTVTQ